MTVPLEFSIGLLSLIFLQFASFTIHSRGLAIHYVLFYISFVEVIPLSDHAVRLAG
ncbi:hypothetical protein MtrunA17_Chr1g0186621 [Medicago truncatula]|uniref:Transmembrane protein n=1 Tax=Medicago truncatula TaxID=3880 RepID=A0A396JVP1_MEDTR|nr:hypothetical protein MtrunA17_Chr1g0186621 [Medicago truncatula]